MARAGGIAVQFAAVVVVAAGAAAAAVPEAGDPARERLVQRHAAHRDVVVGRVAGEHVLVAARHEVTERLVVAGAAVKLLECLRRAVAVDPELLAGVHAVEVCLVVKRLPGVRIVQRHEERRRQRLAPLVPAAAQAQPRGELGVPHAPARRLVAPVGEEAEVPLGVAELRRAGRARRQVPVVPRHGEAFLQVALAVRGTVVHARARPGVARPIQVPPAVHDGAVLHGRAEAALAQVAQDLPVHVLRLRHGAGGPRGLAHEHEGRDAPAVPAGVERVEHLAHHLAHDDVAAEVKVAGDIRGGVAAPVIAAAVVHEHLEVVAERRVHGAVVRQRRLPLRREVLGVRLALARHEVGGVAPSVGAGLGGPAVPARLQEHEQLGLGVRRQRVPVPAPVHRRSAVIADRLRVQHLELVQRLRGGRRDDRSEHD
mmetsp:Transcript_3259/g.9472  ORF Transcript_3259/g.9472 Transcript_3259/m.9472 type:complete len:427 (+) Transcript_3259:828-2108(+)|eukprot:CAMPEP_0118850408 /NCGR_PEP_ID=MMETSP1163-20130328/281_1 /TAXON_ID=124430 /ORGANISM="Phaeomonas parva, Strain CCMP2877" /LENGTH=426 /DNA_ID=CAMNT_0006782617 /DNA_START=815 /DNA_END=2095 /DNA_ORIENTATION=+